MIQSKVISKKRISQYLTDERATVRDLCHRLTATIAAHSDDFE